MRSLRDLPGQGQSIWLDAIGSESIDSGKLRRLIEEDGLRSVTSNPTIFDRAISRGGSCDAALRVMPRDDFGRDAQVLHETLAVEDIPAVADLLRAVFEANEGGDGFAAYLDNRLPGCVPSAANRAPSVESESLFRRRNPWNSV